MNSNKLNAIKARWKPGVKMSTDDVFRHVFKDMDAYIEEIERLRDELFAIQEHAFACMEGAGMPEFQEYDYITCRARKALEDK